MRAVIQFTTIAPGWGRGAVSGADLVQICYLINSKNKKVVTAAIYGASAMVGGAVLRKQAYELGRKCSEFLSLHF